MSLPRWARDLAGAAMALAAAAALARALWPAAAPPPARRRSDDDAHLALIQAIATHVPPHVATADYFLSVARTHAARAARARAPPLARPPPAR